jgi:hypothetical protein
MSYEWLIDYCWWIFVTSDEISFKSPHMQTPNFVVVRLSVSEFIWVELKWLKQSN